MQYANGCSFALNYSPAYSPRMNIGDRLDKAMRDANIPSQSALARASGVPQATISRILKGPGLKGPETDTIKKLASACGVTAPWLTHGEGVQEDPKGPVDLYRLQLMVDGEMIRELITLFINSTETGRELILKSAGRAPKIAAYKNLASNDQS
jgi:transcriptional regulator with XRE-family HTH domain